MNTEPEEPTAIEIFRLLQVGIAKINSYPLTTENMVIQHDAYQRLGSSEPDDEDYEVFAVLEQGRRQKDSEFRYMLQLTENWVLFEVENYGQFTYEYGQLGDTAKEIADQLMSVLIMLANGQLLLLHTTRHGRPCASELIYKAEPHAAPMSLSIDADYPRFLRNDDPAAYDTHVMANSYDLKRVPIPKDFFLLPRDQLGKPVQLERPFESGTLSPLTKAQYQKVIADLGNVFLGVQDNSQFEEKVRSSWVLWGVMLLTIAAVVLWMPSEWYWFGAPLAGLGGLLVGGFMTGKYMMFVKKIADTTPEHWVVRFDRFMAGRRPIFAAYALSLCAVAASTLLPVYAEQFSHRIITLYQLVEYTSWLVLTPLALQALALGLLFVKNIFVRSLSAVVALLSIITLGFINFGLTYAGDDVTIPGLAPDAMLLAYLAQIVFAIGVLVSLYKKPGEQAASLHAQASHIDW